jgi:D-alanyl-D-alanine dipeptidase
MTMRVPNVTPVVLAMLVLACQAPRSERPAPEERPSPAPAELVGLIGEYESQGRKLIVYEERGILRVREGEAVTSGSGLSFSRDGGGQGREVVVDGVRFTRRPLGPTSGNQLKITPMRPVPDLIREALAATPPAQPAGLKAPDLVDLSTLDSTIKFDIRYATTNNFVGTVFYSQPRAFLQRPAAEGLLAAHRWLRQRGYGLLIHDAYRPWYVTRVFWDATPDSLHWLVANPADGSRHNRGAAVDLTLYDLASGEPVEMVGTYDESTERSLANYPGGTSLQRWHRALLKTAMEANGFTVLPDEWWHFDYDGWREYPVLNLRFEDIRR